MKTYLSHKISGGDSNSSNALQKKNCDEAVRVGKLISAAIPSLELYVPGGQSEEFVSVALKKGFMTVEQVLDVDCTIIDGCEAVIVYVPTGDELRSGRLVEYDHAVKTDKSTFIFNENEVDAVVGWLARLIMMG